MINELPTQIGILAYRTFQEFNKTNLEGMITYPSSVWYGFTPLLLFSFFIIVLSGTYFGGRRLFGVSDFFGSFATAGFSVAVIAFFMTKIEGLIDLYILTFCVVIAIVGVILLFITRER